jgi:hypothetical protein
MIGWGVDWSGAALRCSRCASLESKTRTPYLAKSETYAINWGSPDGHARRQTRDDYR